MLFYCALFYMLTPKYSHGVVVENAHDELLTLLTGLTKFDGHVSSQV